MRTTIRVKHMLWFLAFVSGVGSIKAQSATVQVPMGRQVANSHLIVEGQVIQKQAMWDEDYQNIYTVNTVQVYKVFKGELNPVIQVITPGGTVGLDSESVHPSLHLNMNDIGLFMLEESILYINPASELPKYRAYSDAQGFFQYNFAENIAANSHTRYKGITTSLYDVIATYTQRPFTAVTSFNVEEHLPGNNTGLPQDIMAITGFTPTTASAGTKTVLTITGSGFGNTKGSVKFKDPDTGGNTLYAALNTQIVSWTNTQIKVEIPTNAGTGTVVVETNTGTSMSSLGVLTIEYSETTVISDSVFPGINVAYANQHVNKNSNEGYVFNLYSGFAITSGAEEAFSRALNTWVCDTGVNWVIGDNSNVNTTAADNLNIVRFDSGNELPEGVLGRCTTRSSGCFVEGGTSIEWYVKELDLRFNDTTNFNYSIDTPGNLQYDFESIALHELGHGHLLSHVIDTNEVMNYNIANGEMNRELSLFDVSGGADIHIRSTNFPVCNENTMTNATCNTTAIEEFSEESILIYPNPVADVLYLDNTEGAALERANVFDLEGRLILTSILAGNYTSQIDLSGVSNGIYLLQVQIADSSFSRKIVKE